MENSLKHRHHLLDFGYVGYQVVVVLVKHHSLQESTEFLHLSAQNAPDDEMVFQKLLQAHLLDRSEAL